MELNREKILDISIVFGNDESSDIGFYERGSDPEKEEYTVGGGGSSKIRKWGPLSDDDREFKEITLENFLKEINEKNLDARLFQQWVSGKEEYMIFTDWAHLANYLGISKLVVLSTKVPEIINKRFEFFASDSGNKASILRGLVIEYVKSKSIDQIDAIIHNEDY